MMVYIQWMNSILIPLNNLQAVPWGSTAAENGTSKDAPIMDADGGTSKNNNQSDFRRF